MHLPENCSVFFTAQFSSENLKIKMLFFFSFENSH